MRKQIKGFSCFSVSAILVSAIIFIFGLVEIAYVSSTELQKTEAAGTWPFDQRPGYIIFVVAISFLLPPFPLIIAAVVKRQRLCILWACFFLAGSSTSLLVFGAVTIRTSQKDLSDQLFEVMKSSRTDSKVANWISLLQYEYKCCGVTGYSDWSLFEERSNSSDFVLPEQGVPYTCCRREDVNIKAGCGHGVLKMDGESIKKIIYTRACGPVASKVFQGKLLQLGLEMLIAAFASVVSAIFLYCGATDLFCFGSTIRNFKNNVNNAAQVESRKSGGSDLSFQLDQLMDENENNIHSGDKPDSGSIGLQNKVRIKSSKELMRRQMQQNGRTGRRKGPSSIPQGHVRMQQALPNDTRSLNSSTSSKSRSRSSKGKPVDDSGLKGLHQKFQVKALVKGRHVLKDHSSERKKSESHSKGHSRHGHSHHARSAIAKDINANPTRNNKVETLFKGIDMNSSALSTTPTSHSHVNFPWTNKNGSRSSTVIGKATPSILSMKDPSLQGIKAALPTFSHFSSLPMFQIVKLHTGESTVLGRFPPHFSHKTLPLPSSTIYSRQAYIAVPTPSFFKATTAPPDDVPLTETKDLEPEGQAAQTLEVELPPLPIIQCEETMTIGKQDDSDVSSQPAEMKHEIEAEATPSTDNSINSTARSSTIGGPLSTIEEESESLKSSPENGSSREVSELNSPKGSEYAAVGGGWHQSTLGQPSLTSSIKLKSQQEDGMIMVKEIPSSVERTTTGEFQV